MHTRACHARRIGSTVMPLQALPRTSNAYRPDPCLEALNRANRGRLRPFVAGSAIGQPARRQPVGRACALNVGFSVGYAERTPAGERFNTAILVQPDGAILGRYRKVHLPGSVEPRPGTPFQQLEKRYFHYGDTGFPTFRANPAWQSGILGMMICNDRRWPESWRMLGLGGVELVCVGYNSAAYDPNGGTTEDAGLRTFHAKLVVQANAYMNATWAIAVAKAGDEDGSGLIGGSCIVDPNGVIVAETKTLADEVIIADCDLEACRQGKEKMFNFAAHRRPEHYRLITETAGAIPPAAV